MRMKDRAVIPSVARDLVEGGAMPELPRRPPPKSLATLGMTPSCFILHPSSFILHPSSLIRHPSSLMLHPSCFILHASSLIPHPSCFILRPSSFILHPSSLIPHPSSLSFNPQPSYFCLLPSAFYTWEMIDSSHDGTVTTITLNRPEKLNAFSGTMREDLLAALREASDDRACHVVVITGAGRAFCAGGDVSFMHELQSRNDVEGFRKLLRAGAEI